MSELAKFKAFLKRKNIEISFKRYGIDALGAMAQGLFCSLLIGTIIGTIGNLAGIEFLSQIGGYTKDVSGVAMAVAIGYALKADPMVLFSLATVGYAANTLGGAGGPLAVLIIAIIAAEFGKAVSKETKIDILVTPAVTILVGVGLAALIAKPIGDAANAFTADNASVVMGANDPVQLNELNRIARTAILNEMIAEGVSLTCTDGVIIGPDVSIGSGTVILPGTILKGRVTVGSDCTIGPNTMIENSVVHDRVIINASQVKQSEILEGTDIGPFSQIRPNCKIGPRVHIGDFVEVKNSVLDEGTKVAHLTYVGDSDIGKRVNFGCGCVTVNYDGQHKARCVVGDDCFIGCNTNLVAPVNIGAGAYTAAGSTITNDIPSDALGIARARQVVKDGWAAAKRSEKK